MYLFRVLFGARGFLCGSLFLSFVSFAMLRCFEQIRFVEGLSSSTHAKTCCFDPSVLQCRWSHEIYAGTLICSARLLDFIGVTFASYDFNFFELRLLVFVIFVCLLSFGLLHYYYYCYYYY